MNKLGLPVVELVTLSRSEKTHATIGAGDSEDEAKGFWGKLDVLNRSVYICLPCIVPYSSRQYYIKLLSALIKLLGLTTFSLFKDEDVLVHATRGDYLTKLGVGPCNPPNRSVVLALDLKGAHPLICQKHLVYLPSDLWAGRIHCARIA